MLCENRQLFKAIADRPPERVPVAGIGVAVYLNGRVECVNFGAAPAILRLLLQQVADYSLALHPLTRPNAWCANDPRFGAQE